LDFTKRRIESRKKGGILPSHPRSKISGINRRNASSPSRALSCCFGGLATAARAVGVTDTVVGVEEGGETWELVEIEEFSEVDKADAVGPGLLVTGEDSS